MTVLIAGGGIGGLTLGLTLHQRGIPFRIFEAAPELLPLGVGINVQPHAVRELFDLGFEDALDATGIRTREVAYYSAQGGRIWSEPRGKFAGYNWPQYSIHRGKLQMMLLDALIERAGDAVLTLGAAVTGWREEEDGVTVTLTDRASGRVIGEASGALLIGCDGINSAVRAQLYPQEGPARWSGIMMWRGVTTWPDFLTGASMIMAGTKARKFVCYPIGHDEDGRAILNWICDRKMPEDYDWLRQDWNRQGRLEDFLPEFEEWHFDFLDVPEVIRAAEQVWEYPMVDRDPVDAWTFGRVTLLGDAAHAMYPIGSNGASQAILDARVLGRELRDNGVTMRALQAYEADRLPKVNVLVEMTRRDGPDAVLDMVAERAPDGFEDISEVMSHEELRDLADRYKTVAGFDVLALNASPPILRG